MSGSLSTVVLPVHLVQDAVEAAVAENLPETLADEADLLGQGIELRVTRLGAPGISFAPASTTSDDAVVLAVEVGARVELSKPSGLLGSASANGSISLSLRVRARLDNWTVVTSTHLVDHRWIERPQLRVAGLQVGVAKLTDRLIEAAAARITRRIDRRVEQRDPLATAVDRLQASLRVPRPIEQLPGAQLAIEVQRLSLAKLEVVSGGLSCVVAVGFTAAVVPANPGTLKPSHEVATVPRATDSLRNTPLIDYEPSFEFHTLLLPSYTVLTQLAGERLVGQRYARFGQEVRVTSVQVKSEDQRLAIQFGFAGAVNGEVELLTRIAFDQAAGAVVLTDTVLAVAAGNPLMRGLVRFAAGRIAKQIERQVSTESARQLRDARRQLAALLEGGQPVEGVRLDAKLAALTLTELRATPSGVLAKAYLGGAASVRIERIPAAPGATKHSATEP